MGNPLPETTRIGTIGEILVQLRLLEYGVQAAPPIKDSGNDLIAIRGEVVKFIQVKTYQTTIPRVSKLPKVYHLVFLVQLKYSKDGELLLDQSEIFVYKKGEAIANKQKLSKELVDRIWEE